MPPCRLPSAPPVRLRTLRPTRGRHRSPRWRLPDGLRGLRRQPRGRRGACSSREAVALPHRCRGRHERGVRNLRRRHRPRHRGGAVRLVVCLCLVPARLAAPGCPAGPGRAVVVCPSPGRAGDGRRGRGRMSPIAWTTPLCMSATPMPRPSPLWPACACRPRRSGRPRAEASRAAASRGVTSSPPGASTARTSGRAGSRPPTAATTGTWAQRP